MKTIEVMTWSSTKPTFWYQPKFQCRRCKSIFRCRHCSNYVFILDLKPGFDGSQDETNIFTFGDLGWLILEVWRFSNLYMSSDDGIYFAINSTESLGPVYKSNIQRPRQTLLANSASWTQHLSTLSVLFFNNHNPRKYNCKYINKLCGVYFYYGQVSLNRLGGLQLDNETNGAICNLYMHHLGNVSC